MKSGYRHRRAFRCATGQAGKKSRFVLASLLLTVGCAETSGWVDPGTKGLSSVQRSETTDRKKEDAMNTRKVLALASMIAMLCSPVAFSGVLGEKLDSGLGDLSPSYTAAEFPDAGGLIGAVRELGESAHHVAGEKLDSGLGDLSPSYAAAEFQRKDQLARR
jgi:hypothetical protein